jgi:hypothetical protein
MSSEASGPDGSTVVALDRTGLRYREAGRRVPIDSEMLVPPAGVVVYAATVTRRGIST